MDIPQPPPWGPHDAPAMPHMVTLFGDNDALDYALTEELGRRGTRTHAVTVATGWLRSVTHAIVRIDTAVGERALRELTDELQPVAHVIAVCEQSSDEVASARWRDLCRRCGSRHHVSLIWHPPAEQTGRASAQASMPRTEVAAAVADAVGEHAHMTRPAFDSLTLPLMAAHD